MPSLPVGHVSYSGTYDVVTVLVADLAMWALNPANAGLIVYVPDGPNPGLYTSEGLLPVPLGASSLSPKDSVTVGTTGPLPLYTILSTPGGTATLTANPAVPGALGPIDGYPIATGNSLFVLFEGGGNHAYNGVYDVTDDGTGLLPWQLTRRADLNSNAEMKTGVFAMIEEGATYAGYAFILQTQGTINLNVTLLKFVAFSVAGGVTAVPPLTANTLPKASGPATITNSNIKDDGALVTITGPARITGKLTVDGTLDPTEVLLTGSAKKFGATDAGPVFLAPFADAVPAVQIRKADGVTNVVTVDTTNERVGIGTAVPTTDLHVEGDARITGLAVGTPQSDAFGNLTTLPGGKPTPSTLDKSLTPLNVVIDGGNTAIDISATPVGNPGASASYVQVLVNGVGASLGDGDMLHDCYFSADAGVTSKTYATIVLGDILYWNALISGYNLDTLVDKIDLCYVGNNV